MRLLVIATVLLLGLSTAGFAGWPRDGCGDELTASCSLRISVCPAGDFERIANACGGDSDYIEVVIYDYYNTPMAGIPATDFWMNACDTQYELALCAQSFLADSMTGSNGRTTFSGQIAAGGCVPENGIFVTCQGIPIMDYACSAPFCLDVVIVSPDLNADSAVNLSDLSFFGQSYNHQSGEPEYNPCCDFNDDDSCNLSDFSYFGEHYQHECF